MTTGADLVATKIADCSFKTIPTELLRGIIWATTLVEFVKTLPISLSEVAVRTFCQRWQIVELALFGSILREDFRPDSDVDVLVVFAPNTTWNLLDLVTMQQELESLIGRDVDLIEKQVVENSPNWIRSQAILSAAQVFYSANDDL